MEEQIYLTRTGYEELERQLNMLLGEETSEMAERMADVREEANFGEEPAFMDAMTDKNLLDERIQRLRMILQRATIIDRDLDPDAASPGDVVTVRDLDEKEDMEFLLLSGAELLAGRRGVSLGSPVGKAILGRKVGDKVEVKVPDGITKYKILKIEPFQPD